MGQLRPLKVGQYGALSSEDKGNGFRQVKAYSRGKMLALRVPRTREGNFYPVLMSVLRDQEEECRKIAFELYGAGPASAKLTYIKPNARWRAGFSLVPSIPAGCGGKRKVNALFQ